MATKKNTKIKTKQESEQKDLADIIIIYYSNQLTIFQDKIALSQVKIKMGEDNIANVEIEIYSYYKRVLTEIYKTGFINLLTTCSLIEASDENHKLDSLIKCCEHIKINHVKIGINTK